MSINKNFPKQSSLLRRTFHKILLLSFFPPSGGAACWHTFPSFSHLFFHSQLQQQDAGSEFILLRLKTKVKEGASKEIFFPPNWEFQSQPSSFKAAPTLFLVPRTWMKTAFVDGKVLSDQTGKQISGSPHVLYHVQKSESWVFGMLHLIATGTALSGLYWAVPQEHILASRQTWQNTRNVFSLIIRLLVNKAH